MSDDTENTMVYTTAHDLPNATEDADKHIPPTKRFAAKEHKIKIPYVTPWENTAALTDQHGIAFGRPRNATIDVDEGEKPLVQGALHTETFLTKFADTNKFTSQNGMTPIGAHRNQVNVATGGPPPLDPAVLQRSEGIVPRQAGTNLLPTQAGETPFGQIRLQVPRITLKEGMSDEMPDESKRFLSRYMQKNPVNHAGSSVIGVMRPVDMSGQIIDAPATRDKHHKHQKGEGVVPALWDVTALETLDGVPAPGAFRQATLPDIWGGPSRKAADDIECNKVLPFVTGAAALDTQEGTGGFNRIRDPVNYKDPLRPHLPRPLQ